MRNVAVSCLISAMPLFAAPIDYTVNVPGAPSSLFSGASFTYDGSSFTNFLVDWRGVTFDLTASANVPTVLNVAASCFSGYTSQQLGFALITETLPLCNGFSIIYQFVADIGAGMPPTPPFDVIFEGQYPIFGVNTPVLFINASNPAVRNPPPPAIQVEFGSWTTVTTSTPEPRTLSFMIIGTMFVGTIKVIESFLANRSYGRDRPSVW